LKHVSNSRLKHTKEALVQAPIYLMIRNGFNALTRKLVPEVLVSGLATLLVMALFSNVMKAAPPSSRADRSGFDGQLAAATSQTTADFMQRVALSHVAGLKPPPATMASADATSEPATAAAAPLPPRLAAAPGHDKPRAAVVHVAASMPEVLPPPRPPLATIEPAVVSEPAKTEPLRPLRYGMRFVTRLVDFVPASGTRVVEEMASIGGALTSFAKKL
jgi:hypothetical protein